MLVSPSMLCEVKSWIPDAIASTLSLNSDERAPQPVIAWLTNIRASIEEYDPLITVRPHSPESEDEAVTPDNAFDEILSQLGKEIYDLDLYKGNFSRKKEDADVSLSILNIFDECMQGMTEKEMLVNGDGKQTCDNEIGMTSRHEDTDKCVQSVEVNIEIEINEVNKEQRNSENDESIGVGVNVSEGQVNGAVNGHAEYSDCESTLSDVSYVTSTPVPIERRIFNVMLDKIDKSDKRTPPPIPPRRRLVKTPSSASSISTYNNIDRTENTISEVAKRLSDSDSESTCWSYKECSTDGEIDPKDLYAAVWSHSSGFHNSDKILRKVLSQHHATISRIAFDTASDFSPTQYSVYALPEVGTGAPESVITMSPDKPTDDGYERVKDAITTDENIYEEIEYVSYTDEGCSCEGSVGVEMESCSISASSECVDGESPVYVNLRDNDAYAVTADVIFWKNLLLDPYYNDDEEDEWITPEECAVYSREQRPPLVIPRITQYRPAHRNVPHSYEESPQEVVKSSVRQYDRLQDWSPGSERGFKSGSDSPPFVRLNKRYGGSTENLLITSNARRPTHLQLPASSSGDSLDVEVRERPSGQVRSRKSRSMLAPKQRVRSPVPAPRMLIHQPPGVTVLLEGPVKRTKFSENGKKSRKNWVDCYMTLTPTSLVFYKDQKTYYATKQPRPPGTPPSPTAPRAELVLPLQNAHIMQCIQMHTRRYTRSLVLTVGYDQYLLQDETEEGAKRWLMCIQNVYYKLGPPKLDDYPQVQYQSSNTDLESLGRTPPVSRHSNRSNQKAGGSSNEDLSDSTEVSIPKSHVKRRLRNFFAKRPTMDSLVKKGIYQEEPVFGRKLEEVCPSTSPRVPDFVVACIKEIESSEENMASDGLYRASGNLSQVQKIRLEVDQNNLSVIENNTDIHVLTGSLKLFFRELKQPLIPCNLFDRVLAACSIKPREAKIKEFRDIIQSLPPCNRETLKYLLEHLLRVTHYSEQNRMHTANLAIVFGPTLLWAPAEQAHNIAIDCIQQNHVVEILLNDFKEIFVEENGNGRGKKKT